SSIPTFLPGLSPAVSFRVPGLAAATKDRVALVRDLTQHLTTRADDNHAPPVSAAPKGRTHYRPVSGMSRAGKVLRVASN
ncbi:hypothetical protein RUMTOR_02905, partial [[Ruminococcus] torques ATCC 27756]